MGHLYHGKLLVSHNQSLNQKKTSSNSRWDFAQNWFKGFLYFSSHISLWTTMNQDRDDYLLNIFISLVWISEPWLMSCIPDFELNQTWLSGVAGCFWHPNHWLLHVFFLRWIATRHYLSKPYSRSQQWRVASFTLQGLKQSELYVCILNYIYIYS